MPVDHGAIAWVLRHPRLVWLMVVIGVVASLAAVRQAPLDAIPDISDPQVVIYAKWQRSPQLLEEHITAPVIRALLGTPGVASLRATSHMGYSFIYVILSDASNREAIRRRVGDRLNAIRSQLPADATVTLGPDAGSMGWIYQYALSDTTQTRDLRQLRLLNERQVKPTLQTTPGIAEVASVGGLEEQFQFRLYPPLLAATGLTLPQIAATLRDSFGEVGGRTIEIADRDYQLRGSMDYTSLDSLESLSVGRDRSGQIVRLKDIGYLQVDYDIRRGIADLDGNGEVVGGIVVMQQGENVLAVRRALQQRLDQLSESLPAGVQLVPTYDRSELIWTTLRAFAETLAYELLVVVLIIALFLRNLRTAIVPICVLLLATLFTVLPLAASNHTINLLSLAGLAIAIGEMVDAAIVIVENCAAELERQQPSDVAGRRTAILQALRTVVRPLLFSLLIILASFLPIFFLDQRDARLFDPLALTKTGAMAFSTLLTVCLLPILVTWALGRLPSRPPRARGGALIQGYRYLLERALRWRYALLAVSLLSVIPAYLTFQGFRHDYMPELEEGSILYMPTTLPGVPMREAGWILQEMDRKLKEFPEVERVFGKLGRADTATDSAPVTMVETTVLLRPKSAWRPGMTKEKLIAQMNDSLQIVGFANTWTQPMSARVLMQTTGIQTPVGLKIVGPDITTIAKIAKDAERLLRDVPGTVSVIAERIADGYFVDAVYDADRMAAQSVTLAEAEATVRFGLGGENVTSVPRPDQTRVPLSLRYSGEYADTLQKVTTSAVITASGRSVPLNEVATVGVRKMPEMLRDENGQLAGFVYVYLGDVTAPDYVTRARDVLDKQLQMPDGYRLEWTGLYRYAEEARARLLYVVPLTLLIIFGLLWVAFGTAADTLVIMLSVPFALVGGVFLQAVLGYPMTTAVTIGYIALFAVAIQTGIVMIVFIREALERRSEGDSYMEAVVLGATARLRPKLMTVAATVLSLFPVMLSRGPGMELMRPIATPTVGGMATSAIYVLFLIPCIFAVGDDVRRWRARRSGPSS